MRPLPRFRTLLVLAALTAGAAACTESTNSTNKPTAPVGEGSLEPGELTVYTSESNDTSAPLRDLVRAASTAGAAPTGQISGEGDAISAPTPKSDPNKPKRTIRKKIIPRPEGDGIDPAAQTRVIGPRRTVRPDGSMQIQGTTAPASASAPTVGSSFDSIGAGYSNFTVNSAPPDTNSAVGTNQIVTSVNGGFTVQSKTGTRLLGPAPISTVFSGFGGPCSTTNDGDGVIRYDRMADRWIISQFSIYSTPYYECVAVSKTGDATGEWNRYAFAFNNFPDYPKFSVWPDAYYVTYNMFSKSTGAWMYATACAMDRAAMIAGTTATQVCYNTSSSYGGLLAADLDSAELPPAGAYNPIIALGVSNNDLAVWRMKPDFVTPANSKFLGPTPLGVSAYSMACGGGNCVSQPGTTNVLDGLGDRLMFRYAYRNFGTHQAAVVAHSVNIASSVHGSATTGVRWYEIRFDANDTASVYQQGTYTPDSTFRWMPSIAMDKAGNIALGYNTSSSTKYPSLAVTGRLATDTLGTMTQGETTVHTGTGSQTGTLRRWGDYASMVIDPTDDCTFWFSGEYLKSSGSFNWSTRIASFTMPGCVSPITDAFTLAATSASGSVNPTSSVQTTVNSTTTLGNGQTVALSVSGLPAGATASFSPSSISTGSSSTLTISTTSSTPGGVYNLLITGAGPLSSASTTYALTVNSFGVSLSPTSGTAVKAGASVSSTVSVSRTGAAQSVALSATGMPSGVTAAFGSTSVNSGSSTTLTFTASSTATAGTYTITVTGAGTTISKTATYTLTVRNPVENSFLNPGFESSSSALTSWVTSGASTGNTITPRTGLYAARAGNTTATSGDSRIAQTVVAPAGATRLSFWYRTRCRGTVSKDWSTATLYDATARKTTTILAKTCLSDSGWRQVSVTVTAGRRYTLTLINRDDNSSLTPTYTLYDDILFS